MAEEYLEFDGIMLTSDSNTYLTFETIPILNVSTTTLSLDSTAGSTNTFNITSNVTWTVSDNQTWLTVSPVSGSNDGTILVTATTENPSSVSTRSGVVTISGSGVSNKTVTVTQAVHVIVPLLDKDGNVYTAIEINNQEWISESLRTTTFADGSPIDGTVVWDWQWEELTTPAYCIYDNNTSYKARFGCLYNWLAVVDTAGLAYLERGGVQETGWRVPTSTDYTNLKTFLGLNSGTQLKEAGNTNWSTPSNGTDIYGFSGRGSGHRFSGSFGFERLFLTFDQWTSTEFDATGARVTQITSASPSSMSDPYRWPKYVGLSVRLVRDIV